MNLPIKKTFESSYIMELDSIVCIGQWIDYNYVDCYGQPLFWKYCARSISDTELVKRGVDLERIREGLDEELKKAHESFSRMMGNKFTRFFFILYKDVKSAYFRFRMGGGKWKIKN